MDIRSSRSSSSFLDELRSESFQKIKESPSKLLQELKDLYQSPYVKDGLMHPHNFKPVSKFGVERTSVRSLYQTSKLKEEAAKKLKVLRSLKKDAEDDLFDLVSRTSISRRTSVVGSPLPTRMPSISAVAQGRSIKPRTEHEELMRYIPQPLPRFIEKIDNPPKDGDCGYTCVAWSSGQGRGISTSELIRKHLLAELKKIKKYIRNTQAGKSAGVAGWLKMPLFGLPSLCMAFVNSNHYVVLHFKKVNGSIPAPPIGGWWLRKSSSKNKNLWLQSLENDLKLFQKLMPSSSGGAVIN
ncbi:hypothetical protein PPACK8108_LOCUS12373 [Phakopsora pachyrhizi]|uniref:OTU domain-containing protein n=1 Tax=Phakopsora pachyrhizi TaxID=170000 RepID=A0AAV0B458_PHAPC|nr:hypothetical protein PPACK8108_LOCUS12373 [Phakopsora pachyrhizi]